MRSAEQLARPLVAAGMQRWSPQRLRHGWSAAMWLRGLAAWAEERELAYLRRVYRSWGCAPLPPAVDSADEALPGGVAASVGRRFSFPEGDFAESGTAAYLESEPLNVCGVFDHVGPRSRLRGWMKLGRLACFTVGPSSLWADSMMMYVWSAEQIGRRRGDTRWCLLAQHHALAFAHCLQRPSGLFAHAYEHDTQRLFPLDGSVWLRAHGWMLAVLADLLSNSAHPELEARFARALEATLSHQNAGGLFPNVLGGGVAGSPPELSGNALVLYALARSRGRFGVSADTVSRVWQALLVNFVEPGAQPGLRGATHTTPVRGSGARYDRGFYAAWSKRWPGWPPHAVGSLLLAASAMARTTD